LILFYVQHLLGIGHLRRTLAIARACVDQGLCVEVVSGGLPVDLGPHDALRIHQLKPLKSADLSFSQVVDHGGVPLTESMQKERTGKLLEIFHELQPDLLVTELFPFGRRRFRFELLPLLEAARAGKKPVICSVRDSVQQRSEEREKETIAWLRQYYAKVLVHGDERFMPFGDSFGRAGEIADLLKYTGFVDTATKTRGQTPLDAVPEVLVSAGGGSAGESLYLAAAEASSLSRHASVPWRILAGAGPEPALVSRLKEIGSAQLTVEANRPDFRDLLGECRLSVSQAGYNSVVDLLSSGAPALLSPFTGEGGETEQPARAEQLSAIGRAQVIGEDDLEGGVLAARVDALLDSGPERFAPQRCDGAAQTAKVLKEYFQT